ncbi:MAG: glutathione peroxidase [Betaproteobacteria bacterium]|nr:glutathione peroxidase [Betaproteobacteria bacterium]
MDANVLQRAPMGWLILLFFLMVSNVHAAGCPPLLDAALPTLSDDKPESICQYRGKVLLVVNTASECGYTPQYEGLEKLYRRFKGRGLVVLGFPSNDFGGQEPGSNKEIAKFCVANYGVSFPMFTKTSVAKGSANAFYEKLAQATGSRPGWNFHKYLVDRGGSKAVAFDTRVEPSAPKFLKEIERLLSEKGDAK